MKYFFIGGAFVLGFGISHFFITPPESIVSSEMYMKLPHDTNEAPHTEVEVGEYERVPSVAVTATPDSMSGFNVNIMTENFTFAPERAGGEYVPGEGHVHLYVNDKKVARVYGEWYHLDGLPKGEHVVSVTLNGNNHAELVVGGAHLEDRVVITVE